jgi:hypothetical protein
MTDAGKAPREAIQSLWIGSRLSLMEQLCIRSFQAHGHPFHLYVDQEPAGVPADTVLHDVREILPDSPIHRYQSGFGVGSPALYSDIFRMALLHQRGGWWVDMDVVALQPFPETSEPVLGSVVGRSGRRRLNSGVIRLPARSRLAQRCLEAMAATDLSRVGYGETGPGLIHRAAEGLGLERFVQPQEVFYPVGASRVWDLIRPGALPTSAIAIHLWQNLWRHYGIDPDRRYPAESPYEQLLRHYHPEAAAAPRAVESVPMLLLRSLPHRARMWMDQRRKRVGAG